MMLTELIIQLESIQDDVGDCEVLINDFEYGPTTVVKVDTIKSTNEITVVIE